MSVTSAPTDSNRRLVVVGTGSAGLRAAESARRAGFTGEIVLVGAEPHHPYDRPTLSKGALVTPPDPEVIHLPVPALLDDARWLLGTRVESADLAARTVRLDDGTRLGWDGLVIATGLRARRLDLPGPTAGRLTLRSLDDSVRLRSALTSIAASPSWAPSTSSDVADSADSAASAGRSSSSDLAASSFLSGSSSRGSGRGGRVVVVGAGFVGCEVAYAAASLGLDVTVVAPEAAPLLLAVGEELGRAVQRRQEALGVRFHLGTVPVGYEGGSDTDDRVRGVSTADGERLPADLVVEAVGSAPVVDLLNGQGTELSDGVLVDGQLRVLTGPDASARPDVVACGDVARFPDVLFDDVPRRIEHWTLAADTGKRAGRTVGLHLAGAGEDARPFTPVPTFWSEQCGVRLQSFGLPSLGLADARVLQGDLDGDVVVGYHREGRLVGVVMIGFEAEYRRYRNAIASTAE